MASRSSTKVAKRLILVLTGSPHDYGARLESSLGSGGGVRSTLERAVQTRQWPIGASSVRRHHRSPVLWPVRVASRIGRVCQTAYQAHAEGWRHTTRRAAPERARAVAGKICDMLVGCDRTDHAGDSRAGPPRSRTHTT